MKVRVSGLAMIVGLLSSGIALGQEAEGTEGETMEATATDEAAAAEPAAEGDAAAEEDTLEGAVDTATEAPAAPPADPNSLAGDDGVRFRFGIAGGGGFMTGLSSTLVYGGGDLKLGAQINDMLAVYAVPQLGYYTTDGVVVGGGLVGASAVVDVTLIDRFFVGAGVGYAILNNLSGPELHLRAGGYPIMVRSDEKIRRKGLMLGVDFRVHFLDGATIVAPTFNIGYEAF